MNDYEQGVNDATHDFEENWVAMSICSDKRLLTEHLQLMIGASDQYIDGYYDRIKELTWSK